MMVKKLKGIFLPTQIQCKVKHFLYFDHTDFSKKNPRFYVFSKREKNEDMSYAQYYSDHFSWWDFCPLFSGVRVSWHDVN